MKALVNINKNAAIQAGNEDYGLTVIDFNLSELSEMERVALTQYSGHSLSYETEQAFSGIDIKLNQGYAKYPVFTGNEPHLEMVKEILASDIRYTEEKTREDKEEAEQSKKRIFERYQDTRDWLIDGDRELVFFKDTGLPKEKFQDYSAFKDSQGYYLKKVSFYINDADKLLPEKYKEVLQYIEEVNQKSRESAIETLKKNIIKKYEIEKEGRAKSKRKADQINKWVLESGTDNQKKRHSVDLLPKFEAVDAIRQQAYEKAGLLNSARYEKIKSNDIEHDEEECRYESDVECSVDPAPNLSAEQFEILEAIQADVALTFGGNSFRIEVLSHYCECESCVGGLRRDSAKVWLTVGEFEFSREYALD